MEVKTNKNFIFLAIPLSIITYFISIFILSELFLLLKIGLVSFIIIPLSFIISLIPFVIFIDKIRSNYLTISYIVLILSGIYLISISLSLGFFDTSWDGQEYHQAAIIKLKEGWNPLYENIDKQLSTDKRVNIWINHYPIASWLFGANLFKFTNNIEIGKMYNFLFMFASFFLTLYLLLSIKLNRVLSVILSLIASCNPVSVYQSLSFYIDGFMGSLLLCIFALSYIYFIEKKKIYLLFIGFLFITIINIKFTGIIFSSVIAIFTFIGILLLSKNFKKSLLILTILSSFILIGIIVFGYSPYIKNTIIKGNPLYPVYGEDKIDIISNQYPYNFRSFNYFERLIHSVFSYTGGQYSNEARTFSSSVLKIPFTIQKNEIFMMNIDPRVGGFGPFFGGAIIISTIIIIISIIMGRLNKNNTLNLFLLFIILEILISALIIPESWWARFVPQLWFFTIVPIVMLFINIKEFKFNNLILSPIVFILILNIFFTAYNYYSANINDTKNFNEQISIIKQFNLEVYAVISLFEEATKNRLKLAGISYSENYKNITKKYQPMFLAGSFQKTILILTEK